VERRVVLKLIAAGVLAPSALPGQHHRLTALAPQQAAAYTPEFFSLPQYAMLDRLTDVIIPTTERSPGAHEARVAAFIDIMLTESSAGVRKAWRDGLNLVDTEARRQFNRTFLELTPDEQDRIVTTMAADEGQPANSLERFFSRVKRMTVDGYYSSQVGIEQELRYDGELPSIPGCAHPEHQA